MPDIKENFKAAEVDLIRQAQGVEASAGTGKTYSIALLAVRLLLKTEIQIDQILMVTFTRAAVAELQLRVRAFVRKALQVTRDPDAEIENDDIRQLVQEVIRGDEQRRKDVLEKLELSSILLEDLPVFTIHGFCGRLLKEYAFETLQVFDAEVMSESESVRLTREYFHEFWRSEVATIQVDVLGKLLALEKGTGKYYKTFREICFSLVRAGLAGKAPFPFDDHGEPLRRDPLVLQVSHYLKSYSELKEKLMASLAANKQTIVAGLPGKKGIKVKGLLLANQLKTALDLIIEISEEKNPPDYISENVTNHLPEWESFVKIKADLDEVIALLAARIAWRAFRFVSDCTQKTRRELAVTTFDDMILQVRQAVESPDHLAKLRNELRLKYKAVFIDEFQDTDINQYVIFSSLFGQDHYLYYIGDPKQSIYGFRKADIHTYLRAMGEVAVLHRMNVNFRSNNDYIEAMNRFFKPNPDFNTFELPNNLIQYHTVEAPPNNNKPVLCNGNEKVCPIQISVHEDDYQRLRALRATVHELLKPNGYKFSQPEQCDSKENSEPVRCRDISILVKKKEMGRTIAEMLSSDGLPVVTVSDKKIFESPEAEEVWQILTGIHELTTSAINRAMVTRIAGIGATGLLTKNQEQIMERFRKYHDTWKTEGVYVMMQQFMADHGLHERFYNEPQLALERTIANMMQLVDLIHTHAAEMNLDQTDQLRWLRLAIDGEDSDNDEYVQRLERDEEAIRVVTIHSSKGLEYPIILCPDLEFKIQVQNPIVSYRDDDGEFVTSERSFLDDYHHDKLELANHQQEEEYRRLLYVAITRARQACFIFTSAKGNSAIQIFKNAINPTPDSPYIRLWTPPSMPRRRRQPQGDNVQLAVYSEPPKSEITDLFWRKVSFTRLTPEKESARLPAAIEDKEDVYSDFVFRKLRRGAQTGNMLHAILEAIDFSRPEGWKPVVERMMKRYMQREMPDHANGIISMLHHLTNCKIPGLNFTLSELNWNSRLVEIEFDMNLRRFNVSRLSDLSTEKVPMLASLGHDGQNVEGILNGFMDLFFEQNGKYYILDWKSNYLGDQLSDYSADKLAEAMTHSNYHLQYMLYTVAACRYLRLRMKDFRYEEHFGGVIYIFLRGVRSEGTEGIFYSLPDKNTVEAVERLFQGKDEAIAV